MAYKAYTTYGYKETLSR